MGSCFFPWHSSNESLYHCRVWNRGCCLSKCNCTICLCVFSEALSSVEKLGSTSARVDILSTSGIPVSLGVERSSFPSPVNAGVVLSSKVLNLDSGSLVTYVTPETMEKLCSSGFRPLVKLCVESAGFSRRCTGVAVPLRVVPSATGLPSKRGPGLGSFSRADRGIGGARHVAPPTWLVSNFLVRLASS